MPSSALMHRLAGIFRPPFSGLGVLIWFYFVLCFLVYPGSRILGGEFIDSDDYMILTHVIDWLKGQGWFDTMQYRLSPPTGAPMHFSRIAELPLAGAILLLRAMGLEWVMAATVAAAVLPLLFLAGMLAALKWTAKSLMPRDWSGATAFVALFSGLMLLQFSPGRADHHGIALLITTMAFGFSVRMLKEPENLKWSAGAGFSLALGQTVSLETLVVLVAISSFVCLWIMMRGRPAARAGIVFGLTLYLASIFFLVVVRPPHLWFVPEPLVFSIVYMLLAGSVAVCCAGIAMVSAAGVAPLLRYLSGFAIGLFCAVLFFSRFPELLEGPYGAIDVRIKEQCLHTVESTPYINSFAPLTIFLFPFFALLAAVAIFPERKKETLFFPWLLSIILLSLFLALTVFYAKRSGFFAALFGIIPLTEFLRRSLSWSAARLRGRRLFAMELFLLLLVGPLPSVLLPALIDGRSFNKGVLLFPAVESGNFSGDAAKLALFLNTFYGDRSLIIMNSLNDGAELLFRTGHNFIAAPYHTNVSGIVDSTRFFSTTDPEEARKTAQERKADLVVLNKNLPASYLGKSRKTEVRQGRAAGTVSEKPSFAEMLIEGKAPEWLKPLDTIIPMNFLAFEIVP